MGISSPIKGLWGRLGVASVTSVWIVGTRSEPVNKTGVGGIAIRKVHAQRACRGPVRSVTIAGSESAVQVSITARVTHSRSRPRNTTTKDYRLATVGRGFRNTHSIARTRRNMRTEGERAWPAANTGPGWVLIDPTNNGNPTPRKLHLAHLPPPLLPAICNRHRRDVLRHGPCGGAPVTTFARSLSCSYQRRPLVSGGACRGRSLCRNCAAVELVLTGLGRSRHFSALVLTRKPIFRSRLHNPELVW